MTNAARAVSVSDTFVLLMCDLEMADHGQKAKRAHQPGLIRSLRDSAICTTAGSSAAADLALGFYDEEFTLHVRVDVTPERDLH